MNQLLTAMGYIRRSKESTERTVSLGSQMEDIERYAEKHGLTVLDFVIDDGVSGREGYRLDLLHTATVKRGCHHIIVAHHDRLARKVGDALTFIENMTKEEIAVHVCTSGRVEVETAEGYLSTAIQGVLAEHYRILVASKTKAALAHLKEKGRRYSNIPPLGREVGPAGMLRVNHDEIKAAELAKALRYKTHSYRVIARLLEAQGYTNRHGEQYSASSIKKLLEMEVIYE